MIEIFFHWRATCAQKSPFTPIQLKKT